MTSTLLTNELTTLSSESKRKNIQLRNAADKSLQELKAIQVTSEQQLAADLSRRTSFIEPFLIACSTQNAKFANSGVTCLQKLVISRGLPKARLQETLQAFNSCTELGLDVQLKILQALPSLLQNYADDLKGDLLSGALEVCASLQSAKVQTVSGVAAATLQQLVTSVFEKVAAEDRHKSEVPAQSEVPGTDGPIKIRPAAFDAYRVLRDLILAAEDRKTTFVQFASLSQDASLELIWSGINSSTQLFESHAELANLVRTNLLPVVTRALSERLSFARTIRCLRILNLVLTHFVTQFPAECEVALGLLTHSLDPEAAPSWKRTAGMEIIRDFFIDGNRVIEAYAIYDMAEGGKTIVQDLLSSFVRLSTEKPSVIGLGQQSSAPAGPVSRDGSSEQASAEVVGGVAGMITSALGVAETNVSGISSKWSLPRTSCLEQLDKTDSPALPETYIYALVLECLGSLSDGLAKAILPLTVQHERPRSKGQTTANGQAAGGQNTTGRARSQSFRKRTIPLNPLELESHATAGKVQAVNGLVESCWPAVLATSSTFLNAALDDQYYRSLIKAYQRFAQVAGLLRLNTARDALMTTLGKAAVPPHVLNAATTEPPRTPTTESPRTFSNPKGLLSVDTLVSQASTISIDRDRRASAEPQRPMLTTRNLLCLRAQLNLAIALGPTLEAAFAVVVDTLRQADAVLTSTTPQQMVRQGLAASQKGSEPSNLVQAFTNEVTAVEAAASRLLESTADFPNDAFMNVLNTFCRLLHGRPAASPKLEQTSPPPTPPIASRTFSGLTGINSFNEMQMRDYKFVLPKLGSLAELNISRFVSDDPEESGWNLLIEEMSTLASNNATPKEARRSATGILCKIAAELIAEVVDEEAALRSVIQRRTLAILLRLIDGIYSEDGDLTSSDIDVQGFVVDALRAILEKCGESLVAGWNRSIAILSSVFERSGSPPDRYDDDDEAHIDWENVSNVLVSNQLGKAAFAAAQLICSDFLTALSSAVTPSLVELLHRFASQSDDLNISLTTITMIWNVSDFLLRSLDRKELDAVSRQAKEADEAEEEIVSLVRGSPSAQWLLLLLRLQDIIRSGDKEVRKAALQTFTSIFKNNGHQLSPGAWDLTLRSIILRIAFFDAFRYREDDGDQTEPKANAEGDEAVSIAIINAISEIIAEHMELIEQISHLASLWEAFLSRMEAYLDLDKHKLNAAVFRALHAILTHVATGSKTWNGPMYRTLHLWLKRNPAMVETDGMDSNQDTLVAYVDAGAELYRLTQQSMSMSQTRTLVENLYLSVLHADGPRYGADVSSLSPLQSRVFDLLKAVRSDTASTLVVVAAKMITLHHDTTDGKRTAEKPTFIALSSESITWLQQLVIDNIDDFDLFDSGVIVNVLQNLRHLIEAKYLFKLENKGTPLWRKATPTAVTLSKLILERCTNPKLDQSVKIDVWREVVGIAGGIVEAKGLEQVDDEEKVYSDQLEDIENFKSIRLILTPHLGQKNLPDETRVHYVRALFEASIVHPTEAKEVPAPETSPLHDIGRIRRGRVKHVPFSPREEMCYECLRELISLSSKSDGSPESRTLAKVAAPLTVLRLAIPIRAYIADQPLRGRRPQPLSELEELLFCFDAIGKLNCEPDALPQDADTEGWRGSKAHLRYLYPLLVEAVDTAGDEWSGADEVLIPLKDVLQSLVLWP